MKRTTIVWLLAAICLVLMGGLLFTAVMSAHQWDFSLLSTVKYVTNTYDIRKDFSSISISTDTADILFALSENGKCTVECYEEEKAPHSASVQGDTLVIEAESNKSWHAHFGIFTDSPKITIYLPKVEFASLVMDESTGDTIIPKDFSFKSVDISVSTGDVKCSAAVSALAKIKTTTGNIQVENTTAGVLDLTVSTGKIAVSNVACQGDITINVSTGETNIVDTTCRNLISNGSTGEITLKNTTAANQVSIERSTGDVAFDRADAGDIFIQTNTGDVKGTLRTEKVFMTHSDTGRIDVPKTVNGGRCEISTSTGDILLTIEH